MGHCNFHIKVMGYGSLNSSSKRLNQQLDMSLATSYILITVHLRADKKVAFTTMENFFCVKVGSEDSYLRHSTLGIVSRGVYQRQVEPGQKC